MLGHGAIVAALDAAVARRQIHHAYLFEGPSGIGKRLVADWFARRVNCVGEAPPCGRCARCTRILAGTHPDVVVLEPDPGRASRSIAIDAVREVIRRSGFHRFDADRRVVIVDPADAMAEPAANALLKTLEEPPPGTGFILLATSARHLLPTIVSRCQRVRFGAVPLPEIAAWLTARGAPDADACARLSLGCPGRALALAGGGLQARHEARSTVVRAATSPLAATLELGDALTRKRGKSDWVTEVDLLFEVLEELLRDVAVVATGGNAPLLHGDEPELLATWATRLWPGGVEQVTRALHDARDQLEVNVSGRLVLDALFSRLRAELGTP